MAATTYDPQDVVASFLGVLIGGFADGTFISVDKAEDTFSTAIGAQGAETWVRNRNESGMITFTLQQSSTSNDELSALHELDLLTNGAKGPLIIKDLVGTTVVAAEDARIKKIAPVEYSKDLATRTWVVECAKIVSYVGGNV